MEVEFRYGTEEFGFQVPETCQAFKSGYGKREKSINELLFRSISNPIGSLPLKQLLKKRKRGKVVIVVSDITRPIPYRLFLPEFIDFILKEGIHENEIIILVATGMHRPSTLEEKVFMFGEDIVEKFKIVDHIAEENDELAIVEGKSWSGAEVKLNKYYVEAGFRILTGLVEPHFMAGFSGGRKAICPGLASLETVQKFHGYKFLSQPKAANGILKDNPLHLEASSIASLCPSDFSINVVLDQDKEINTIISGNQFTSHETAVEYVKEKSFITVHSPVDLAITSSGGYPLDDTFYQCVKGFVNCLPALKENGEIIAFGGCSEGIGSPEYKSLMKRYSSRYDEFLNDIGNNRFFSKDQWQFQMHIRTIKKIGIENIHFFTTGITHEELKMLSVTPYSVSKEKIISAIQIKIDEAKLSGKKIAIFPDGPYCSPVLKSEIF
jgi:lactate racemase